MLAMTLNDLISPPVMMAAGLALMGWVILRMRRRAAAGRPKSAGSAPRMPAASSNSADVRAVAGEFHSLLAEVNETSRRIAAQLDNRYMRLEALLADADARIKRLEELTARGGSGENGGLAGPLPTAGAARAAGKAPATRAEGANGTNGNEEGEGGDPRHGRIYDLADRGHSAREIAQLVHCPPGEVELILNLRRKTDVPD